MSSRTVESFLITDREQWKARRGGDITASVAGALFGEHEYLTKWELWMQKAGKLTRDFEESRAMRRGRLMERVAFEMLVEDRPTWAVVMTNDRYYRDPEARIGATPDGVAHKLIKGTARKGAIQAKTTTEDNFNRRWKDSEGNIVLPLWIAIQVTIEAVLIGAEWAAVAVLIIGKDGGLDLEVIDVPVRQSLYDLVKKKTAQFWHSVELDQEPAPDFLQDADAIRDAFADENGQEKDLSGNGEIEELLIDRERLKSSLRDDERRLEQIDTRLIYELGSCSRAHYPGWKIARPLRRRGDVTFRQFEIRRLRSN